MTTHDSLKLELGDRSYNILIGTGLITNAGDLISPVLKQPRVVIVTDENVAPLYLPTLQQSLSAACISHTEIILQAGEQTKSFLHLKRVVDALLDQKIERGTSLIALGGGVIGDLTGFAAAITLRGINFIQIPTTLLSQVDSSVGGKTGINTRFGKNLIGSFYQPRMVLADITSLESLPPREMLAGYAEVVKYGLINDVSFFEWLEENGHALCNGDLTLQQKAVLTSCRAKAAIVSRDEREGGIRALLNLGHTFGHALEAETGYSDILLHGEAVAVGAALAHDLSAATQLCPAEDAHRVKEHYRAVGLPAAPADVIGVDWQAEALISHMENDKKIKDGRLTFILTRGIGKAFVTSDVALEDVRTTLATAISA